MEPPHVREPPVVPALDVAPVLGEVPAPSAVLVRPDGHVAWVGTSTTEGLTEALNAWFGPPAAG